MGATVTVACKLPNGIILTAHKLVEYQETIPGGSRKAFRAQEIGRFEAKGPGAPFGHQPAGRVVGGYMLTPGCPAELWAAFKEQKKDADCIVNNLVFAYEKTDSVVNEAKNNRKALSGLEPLDTGTTIRGGKVVQMDPRWPKSLSKNVTTAATADVLDRED